MCEVNLRVCTTYVRRIGGVPSSKGITVAVSVCAKDEREVCKHWGVSAGSGIEKGKLDLCWGEASGVAARTSSVLASSISRSCARSTDRSPIDLQ